MSSSSGSPRTPSSQSSSSVARRNSDDELPAKSEATVVDVEAAERELAALRERRGSFHRQLEETRAKTWKQLFIDRLKVIIPIAIIFGGTLILVSTLLKDQVLVGMQWAQDNTPISVLYFILFMAVWLVLFLSKSLLSTAAGFVFGFWWGLFGAVAGMMLGLLLTIVITRTVFEWCGWRSRMRAWMLENYLEVRVLNDLLATEPFRAIFLIKMSLLPTWLKSYSLAILDAPSHIHLFVQFLSGTFYSALFVYLGSAAATIVEAVDGGGGVGWESIAINAFGVVITIGVLWYVRKKVKAAIARAEERMDEQLDEEIGNAELAVDVARSMHDSQL